MLARDSHMTLIGDVQPDAFRVITSTQIAVSSGFLTMDPGTMPTSGDPVGYELEHLYASQDREHDLSPVVHALKAWRSPHARLNGQLPRLRLSYGPIKSERVWLASAQYEFPHGMWPGTERPVAVLIRLTLTIARSKRLRERPIRPPETKWHTLTHGETFEDLALAHYGDISVAPLIRRTNPALYEEYPGARVKLLDADHPDMQEPSTPVAPCFAEDFHGTVSDIAAAHLERSGAAWDAISSKSTVPAGTRSLYHGGD